MSLAENLLNSLDETAYANTRIAGGGIEEEHIVVDASRTITVPANLKTIAVKGDKDIETVTIDCIRYWDGHDLSTFAIYLNYILPNGDQGTYIPESITKSEDTFSFDWKIGSEFTYAQGKLTFWIVTKLTDDNGELKKQWSSFQNSDCTIAQGGVKIYVPQKQTDKDVISQAISISRSSAETAEQQANLAKEAAEKAATDAREAAEDEVSRIIGELGVVHELGDSPNSVVSQLKVTKEFNKTNAKINRNSKRITNLEQGLTPDPFVTDDSVAYAKTVPEGALPYAAIHKIGGMTYRDETTNALRSAKVTEVKSVGVNLLDDSKVLPADNVTISNGTVTQIIADTSPTPIFKSNLYNGENYIETVTSYDFVTTIGRVGLSFTKTAEVTRISFGLNGAKKDTLVYADVSNLPDGLYFISVDFTNVTQGSFSWKDMMINKGSTAKPYTPYVEHTLPIPEAVRNLGGYGEGNPDNAEEYNAIINKDGKWKYSHKGNIQNILWVPLATPEVTDISDLLSADNFLAVEGNGSITAVNEYGYDVPSEIEYQLEV